jgi:TonB-dependent SusC/RagA subfamily outer membrane receptor
MVVFVILSCSALSPLLEANSAVIRGRVIDRETAQPLVGATVLLIPRANAVAEDILYSYGRSRATLSQLTGEMEQQGERAGAIVQKDGSFVIKNVKMGDYALTVRYYGYKKFSQDLRVQASETVSVPDVRLALDPQGLEEIVVTGLASRRSKDRAEVAVSRVDAAEYMDKRGMQYSDLSQLLMGKVAGVQVAPSSGLVGSGTRFNVRSGGGLSGYGEPVVYVDGIRFSSFTLHSGFLGEKDPLLIYGPTISTLYDLAPFDVENIELLKGPTSSALYGTQGQNGVILITTKNGRNLQPGKAQVNVRVTQGWNELARPFTEDIFRSYKEINSLFRIGAIADYAVSLSGNAAGVNYYTSLTHRDETGTVANNRDQRSTARVGLELTPYENLVVKLSAAYTLRRIQTPSYLNILTPASQLGPDTNGVSRNFENAAHFPRTRESYESDYSLLNIRRLAASADLTYTPFPHVLPDLVLRGIGAIDNADRTDKLFGATGQPATQKNISSQFYETLTSEYYTTNFDLHLSYSAYLFQRLQSQSTLGAQGYIQWIKTLGSSIPDFNQRPPAILPPTSFVTTTKQSEYREAGAFFQQELSLDDTYFVSAGIRNDFSSSFTQTVAPNIWYPRASFAVRVDKLLPSSPSGISFLKVRGGYGESGILPRADEANTLVWHTRPAPSGFALNIPDVVTVGNPRLEPERVREAELGIETEIADVIGAEVTAYYQYADKSLIRMFVPPSDPFSSAIRLDFARMPSMMRNLGSLAGWGVEMLLRASPVRSDEARLDVALTWHYTDTHVLSLPGNAITGSLSFENFVVGLPRSVFYAPKVLGAEFAADGTYSGAVLDTVPSLLGRGLPVHTGSLSASLQIFRTITLSAVADWALGHSFLNPPVGKSLESLNNISMWRLATQLGLEKSANVPAMPNVARLRVGSPEYQAAANAYAIATEPNLGTLTSGSFLRLREVSLRYDATEMMRSLLGFVRSFALTLSVRNLALLTSPLVIDSELSTDGATQVLRYSNENTTPHARVFNATISFTF